MSSYNDGVLDENEVVGVVVRGDDVIDRLALKRIVQASHEMLLPVKEGEEDSWSVDPRG